MFKINKMPFVLCLSVLCILAGIQGRSISQMGDVKIDISDDKFICDKIECPLDTDLCVVTKHKESDDSTVLIRTDTCYSATKEVLKQSVTNETIDAKTLINVHIEGSRNGMISMGNSISSGTFDSEKFNQDMEKFQTDLQQSIGNMMKGISKMHERLSHMFDF